MDNVDAHLSSLVTASKPATPPLQATKPPASRASSNRNKPGSSSSTARPQGSASGRPVSAGLSAWEDDATQPAGDLAAYMGKADGTSSGTTTPRGPSSGDGNLTQALLAARQAAELERGSSGGGSITGDPGDGRASPRQSLGGASSDGGRSGRVSDTAGGGGAARRGPGRLSQASGVHEMAAADDVAGGAEAPAAPDPERAADARDEAGNEEEESAESDTAGTGSQDADMHAVRRPGEAEAGYAGMKAQSAPTSSGPRRPASGSQSEGAGGTAGGAGPEAGGGAASKDLRGLLYSDDEDGDGDDDYQDLMTADDDALFGNTGSGASGREGSGAARGVGTASGAGTDSPGDGEGGQLGTGEDSLADLMDEASMAPSHRAPSPSPPQSPAPGAEDEPGGRGPSRRGSHTSAVEGGGQPAGAVDAASEATAEKEAAAAAANSSVASGSSVGFRAAWGPEAAVAPPATATSRLPAPGPGAVHPAALVDARYAALPPQTYAHPAAAQQQQQVYYVPLPTAQVGEGLRQHPPMSRRVYVTGQNNRSPIRGSGYVVSPAAVRPPSPPSSPPSRASHHTSHHHPHGGRRSSSSPLPPGQQPASQRPRSPRDASHLSNGSSGGGGGAYPPTPDADPAEPTQVSIINFGFTGPAAPHGGGAAAMYSHGAGASAPFRTSSWTGVAAGGGGGGNAFGRFPPASVQHFLGGAQVYRSMPISQVAGAPSDEMAPGPGGGAGTGAAGAGQAAGLGRNSNSPGRLSGRGGRQQQRPGLPSPHGNGAVLGHLRDRYGSSSAPARPNTSPLRSPRGSSSSARGPRLGLGIPGGVGGGGPLSPSAATAVFGNGVIIAADGGGGERMLLQPPPPPTAPPAGGPHNVMMPPRTLVVPSLPPHGAPAGIRHCGFKQPAGVGGGGGVPGSGGSGAAGAGGSGGLYGSQFSGSRQKANDERMRSAMLAKIIASVAAKEQQHFAGVGQHDFSILGALPHPQLPSATVGMHGVPLEVAAAAAAAAAWDGGGASGFWAPSPASDGLPAVGVAAVAPADLPPHLQRRGSLPHLLAASYQAEHGTGVGLAAHPALAHLQPHGPPSGPANRAAAVRSTTPYDVGLPAVQQAQLVAGAGTGGGRSFSFDVSRRAMSRA